MDRKRYLPCLKEQKDSLLKSLTKFLIQVSAKYLVRNAVPGKKPKPQFPDLLFAIKEVQPPWHGMTILAAQFRNEQNGLHTVPNL